MMESLELVDDDFTLNNAMLCYVWCRMSTIDEVKDFNKFESLTFVDLLEALGQVANNKHLPLMSDLQDAGINSLQWALAKAAGTSISPSSFSIPFNSHCRTRKEYRVAGGGAALNIRQTASSGLPVPPLRKLYFLQETRVRQLWCQTFSRTPMPARVVL